MRDHDVGCGRIGEGFPTPELSSRRESPEHLPLFNEGGKLVPTSSTWGHRHQKVPGFGRAFSFWSDAKRSESYRSRDQLLDRVWGRDIYVDTRTVDVHIGRLRKALCKHGGEEPLRTVRGAGYALG